jgi:ribonuclease P protein component
MSQTFGKARRVRRRVEYQRTFEAGVRVHGRHFTLVLGPTTGHATRLGIVASRKLGDAVRRNRAKRLIREIFRKTPPTNGGPGADIVVIPRGSLFDAPYPVLEADFRSTLRRGISRLQSNVR